MIGLLIDWYAPAVEPAAARRFAASLGAGLRHPIVTQAAGSALLAGTSLVARDRGRWRVRAVEGDAWLAFTGFIGNLDELRRTLARPQADAADLYAAGYARFGDAIDQRAIGDYAAIVVDPGARRVRATRSPIAAPPLHLWHDADRAIVASTPRAVLAGADLAAEVDEQKIADALYLNYTEGERGWYRHVRRVELGTRAWLTPGAVRTERYYDLFQAPVVRLKRDDDYVAAGRDLLAAGARGALDGIERPAISLSGGLDSQAVVAAVLAERPDRPLLGLTAVPEPGFVSAAHPNRFDDERHHVAELAAMYPMLDARTIDTAGLPLDHKLSAMFLMGGIAPRNVAAQPWLHRLYDTARAAGCDAVFNGSMGNVGFSFDGVGALPAWLMQGRWRRLAREINARPATRSLARTVAGDVMLPLLPLPWQRRLCGTASEALPAWCGMNPAYARDMGVRARTDEIGTRRWRDTRQQRAAILAAAGNEIGDIRQGMAAIHGVTTRDPTAYRPLLEFCIGIPDDQFLRGGTARWLARRMLRGHVPDLVVEETRRGRQAADMPDRLGRAQAALLDELDTLARDPAMAARFDVPRLRAALTDRRPGARIGREQAITLRLALPRAIALARFIRHVDGGNR